ncbi:MAG: ABC transporter permease, partial [Anaerolineales bacterium]
MRTAYRKVFRDLWLHKGRTALVVLSIATGAMAVGMILSSNTLMARQMTVAQLASQPSNIWLFLSGLIDQEDVRSLARLPEVEAAVGRSGSGIRWKPSLESEWQDASLTALADYEAQSLDLLELFSGGWPDSDSVAVEWNHVVPYGVPQAGGTIYFEVNNRPRPFKVSGSLRDPGVAAPPFSNQPSFYVTLETFDRLMGTRDFGELRISIADYSEAEAERVAGIVEEKLERQGVGVGFRWYQDPARHWAQDILDGIGLILTVMAVASLFLSAILVINTINAIIAQQVPQIGIMKTVGGVRPQISRLYLAGGFVYGLLSLIVAVPLGGLAGNALESWILSIINVPPARFELLASAVAIQLSTGLVVPLLAALWPVLR